jgi:outer membrane protein
MKKIAGLVLVTFLLLPSFVNAQQLKFGHVKLQDIIVAMPDYKTAVDSINKVSAKYEQQGERLQVEINKIYNELMEMQAAGEVDSLMLSTKFNLFQQMQNNFEDFQANAGEKLNQLQGSLLNQIRTKVQNAVAVVGKELELLYVFDTSAGNPIYTSDKSIDIAPQVKAKLGME